MVFFKQEKRVRLSLCLRTQIRVLPRALLVIVFMPAEGPAMFAMLCLSFDTLLIIVHSAIVNSRGGNEAQTQVSAELRRGNAFLFCTTVPYLYVCGDLGSCNHVLLIFTELRGKTCRAVEICNFVKVIEHYPFVFLLGDA